MAVSCPEVAMYGAYYPYLYGRAGPSRSFYQYERVSIECFVSFFSDEHINRSLWKTEFPYDNEVERVKKKKIGKQNKSRLGK